jgi:para-nitrobenzyl esterase
VKRRDFLLGVGVAALPGAGWSGEHAEPLVRLRSGAVRGRLVHGVRVFTGIPYARAPVGELRFKPPRPAPAWQGEFAAVEPARTPPQPIDPSLPPANSLSEDCLQLNVWAPDGPGPFPVLVWIYGGGNSTGASNLPAYQGDTFARNGVVFVSLNYRVGVLGFLELGGVLGPQARGSGNNALRDQLLALKWVQENIGAFGGNPQKVTLAGQSAGAWNCATLLSLPSAKGLFQQAIVASGGADSVFTPVQADTFARLFLDHLGGQERLLRASTSELLDAQHRAQEASEAFIPFRPVIDGDFLPDVPLSLLRSGAARGITTMVGHTRDEYRTFLSPSKATAPISQNMLLHLPLKDLPHYEQAYQAAFPTLTPGERMVKLLGDETLGLPSLKLAEAQAAVGAPVYNYLLTYSLEHGPFGKFSAHGIDVPLFFDHVHTEFARNVFGFRPADRPMAERVHAAWIDFIKTGQINTGLPRWSRYDLKDRHTMLIDTKSSVAADVESVQRSIWLN